MASDAKKRLNRRVRAVYFRTDEELASVVEGAKLGGVPFCVMLRNAAIREANRLRRLARRRRARQRAPRHGRTRGHRRVSWRHRRGVVRPAVPDGHFRILMLGADAVGLRKDYVDVPVVHVGRSIARRRALPKEKVGE